jgi:hypothetical protein
VNVPASLILIFVLLSGSLTGCASIGQRVKPLEVTTVVREKTPLALSDPEPLKTGPMTWVIVTPDNVQGIWERMERDGETQVLFALTDDGYQQLAVTIAQLRNLIATQRQIILRYREYYEPDHR